MPASTNSQGMNSDQFHLQQQMLQRQQAFGAQNPGQGMDQKVLASATALTLTSTYSLQPTSRWSGQTVLLLILYYTTRMIPQEHDETANLLVLSLKAHGSIDLA
jgi:hypothetical protein